MPSISEQERTQQHRYRAAQSHGESIHCANNPLIDSQSTMTHTEQQEGENPDHIFHCGKQTLSDWRDFVGKVVPLYESVISCVGRSSGGP